MKKCLHFFERCFNRLKTKFNPPYEIAPTPKSLNEKKVLVLDLDETLVHCEFKENPNFNHESILEVIHKGLTYQVYIRRRPYLKEFLTQMSQYYELIIFTAGYESYCDKVLQYIDPEKLISDYFARSHCSFVNGNCVKDLNILERPLDNLIFIDKNTEFAFELQPDNGLLIPSFLDSDEDQCLNRLIPFLKYMSSKNDVRSVSNYQKIYESMHGPLFTNAQLTLVCLADDEEDTLSEGHVVKYSEAELENSASKHRKTQTQAADNVKTTVKPLRSITLLSG